MVKNSHFKKDVALAKKATKKKFAEAKKKLVRAEKAAERFVEKNPKKAVAIAAGIGAAIGALAVALLRRRK